MPPKHKHQTVYIIVEGVPVLVGIHSLDFHRNRCAFVQTNRIRDDDAFAHSPEPLEGNQVGTSYILRQLWLIVEPHIMLAVVQALVFERARLSKQPKRKNPDHTIRLGVNYH